MKHGIQSQKVVAEVIKQKPTVRWLFLTLTVKNGFCCKVKNIANH